MLFSNAEGGLEVSLDPPVQTPPPVLDDDLDKEDFQMFSGISQRVEQSKML
jgi:hypothetical protein